MFSGLAYLGCSCNKSMGDADGGGASGDFGAPAGSTFDLSPLLNTANTAVGNVLNYKLQSQKMQLDSLKPGMPGYIPIAVPSAGPTPGMIVGLAAAGLGVIGLVLLLKRKRG